MNQLINTEMANRSPWAIYLIIAVTPAICEELLFRGFLQQSLLVPYGPRLAILVQAAAFAIFHTSLNRLPYTFALGFLLGFLAWRTASVIPGIVLHFFVNGSEVFLGYNQDGALAGWLNAAFQIDTIAYTSLLTAVLLILGVALLTLKPKSALPPADLTATA